ncbi:MAG: hypothetical protein QM820_36630 [Minicystis sp.]
MKHLHSIATAMATMAAMACGSGTGTGSGGSSQGGASSSSGSSGGAAPVGCADWANWHCIEGNPGCFAECEDNGVICDNAKCGHNQNPICSDFTPSGMGCEDCRALVQGGFCP